MKKILKIVIFINLILSNAYATSIEDICHKLNTNLFRVSRNVGVAPLGAALMSIGMLQLVNDMPTLRSDLLPGMLDRFTDTQMNSWDIMGEHFLRESNIYNQLSQSQNLPSTEFDLTTASGRNDAYAEIVNLEYKTFGKNSLASLIDKYTKLGNPKAVEFLQSLKDVRLNLLKPENSSTNLSSENFTDQGWIQPVRKGKLKEILINQSMSAKAVASKAMDYSSVEYNKKYFGIKALEEDNPNPQIKVKVSEESKRLFKDLVEKQGKYLQTKPFSYELLESAKQAKYDFKTSIGKDFLQMYDQEYQKIVNDLSNPHISAETKQVLNTKLNSKVKVGTYMQNYSDDELFTQFRSFNNQSKQLTGDLLKDSYSINKQFAYHTASEYDPTHAMRTYTEDLKDLSKSAKTEGLEYGFKNKLRQLRSSKAIVIGAVVLIGSSYMYGNDEQISQDYRSELSDVEDVNTIKLLKNYSTCVTTLKQNPSLFSAVELALGFADAPSSKVNEDNKKPEETKPTPIVGAKPKNDRTVK